MKQHEVQLPYQHALGPAELLVWMHSFDTVFSLLSFTILREICGYFPLPALLPASYKHELLIYHLHTGICTVAQRPRRINPRASFCLLDLVHTLVFPGPSPSTMVLHLHLLTLEIHQMPNLLTPRAAPGTLHFQGQIYAFGGKLNALSLADAEKLILTDKEWTTLPDMLEAVANPLPCLHIAKIYILSAHDQGRIQVFSILQQSFLSLQVASSVWNTKIAFISDDTALYRIGEKGDMGIWRIDGERRVFERVGGGTLVGESSCGPVQRGGKVYFLGKMEKICFEVDLVELGVKASAIF